MFIKYGNYAGPPRAEDLRCAISVIQATHRSRMLKIDSLRSEVQELLDHLNNLKVAEDKYLRSLGFSTVAPIAEDGSPTRNPYSTAPSMGLNSRADASTRLVNLKFEDYSRPADRPKQHPSQQDVNLAMNKALLVLRDEDSTARRFEHKILNTSLIVNLKRKELEDLILEQEAVAGKQEREDV